MKEYKVIYNDNNNIPATLWGTLGDKLIIAVHGDLSNKEDKVIELLAKNVIPKGYCVLSFDLPEHGERKNDNYEYNPQNCISDLQVIYSYAKTMSAEISLFACSIGAYFSLLAFHSLTIRKSLFLSPVVNMERVIKNMMTTFEISEQRLENEIKIPLPIGKILDWNYYTFVKQNPVNFNKNSPIYILCGSEDTLSAKEDIEIFCRKYNAKLTIQENTGHYFSSDEQLSFLKVWLNKNL